MINAPPASLHFALIDPPELPTHSGQEVLDTIAGFGYPADEFTVTGHVTVLEQEPAMLVLAQDRYFFWVTDHRMIPLPDDPRVVMYA